MPPRCMWNVPIRAGSPRGQGCSGVAQTSRGWVLPGEQDGLGRAGGRGTPGQEEGVFVQSWLVLTHQPWRSGLGRGIKPEPVT